MSQICLSFFHHSHSLKICFYLDLVPMLSNLYYIPVLCFALYVPSPFFSSNRLFFLFSPLCLFFHLFLRINETLIVLYKSQPSQRVLQSRSMVWLFLVFMWTITHRTRWCPQQECRRLSRVSRLDNITTFIMSQCVSHSPNKHHVGRTLVTVPESQTHTLSSVILAMKKLWLSLDSALDQRPEHTVAHLNKHKH